MQELVGYVFFVDSIRAHKECSWENCGGMKPAYLQTLMDRSLLLPCLLIAFSVVDCATWLKKCLIQICQLCRIN